MRTFVSGKTRHQTDRIWAWIAVAALFAAYLAGIWTYDGGVKESISKIAPGADRIEAGPRQTFTAFQNGIRTGYLAVGQADGYGGPLQVAVRTDKEGTILDLRVVSHKETRAFFKRVESTRFLEKFLKKNFSDQLVPGGDIDTVTGATYTVQALAEAVRQGSRAVAGEQLGLELTSPDPVKVQFGVPEGLLVLLYLAGFAGQRPGFRHKKALRWIMLITGLFFLGFWYDIPLTLSRINSFLLGYWPEWQTHLYWYLLVGGILFIFTVDNKNGYCAWFCPFGAAQDCMGAIGGAEWNLPRRFRRFLLWTQRVLAWSAIAAALIFRNPGVSSYEVFGTLFSFTGSTILFALLAIILLVSLFVKRPWCRFLCPLGPVFGLIRTARTWLLEKWRRTRIDPVKSLK